MKVEKLKGIEKSLPDQPQSAGRDTNSARSTTPSNSGSEGVRVELSNRAEQISPEELEQRLDTTLDSVLPNPSQEYPRDPFESFPTREQILKGILRAKMNSLETSQKISERRESVNSPTEQSIAEENRQASLSSTSDLARLAGNSA